MLHDLRTPLTVIHLHTQLAARAIDRGELDRTRLRRHLSDIDLQFAALTHQVDQMQRRV